MTNWQQTNLRYNGTHMNSYITLASRTKELDEANSYNSIDHGQEHQNHNSMEDSSSINMRSTSIKAWPWNKQSTSNQCVVILLLWWVLRVFGRFGWHLLVGWQTALSGTWISPATGWPRSYLVAMIGEGQRPRCITADKSKIRGGGSQD